MIEGWIIFLALIVLAPLLFVPRLWSTVVYAGEFVELRAFYRLLLLHREPVRSIVRAEIVDVSGFREMKMRGLFSSRSKIRIHNSFRPIIVLNLDSEDVDYIVFTPNDVGAWINLLESSSVLVYDQVGKADLMTTGFGVANFVGSIVAILFGIALAIGGFGYLGLFIETLFSGIVDASSLLFGFLLGSMGAFLIRKGVLGVRYWRRS